MKITTASEQMFATLYAFWVGIASLSPGELAVNLVLTAFAIAIPFAVCVLIRRLLLRGIRSFSGISAGKSVRLERSARFFLISAYVVLSAIAILLISRIWGLGLLGFIRSVGDDFLGTTLKILVLLVITFAAVEAAAFLVNHTFRRLSSRSHEVRRAAQLNTLAPLLRTVLQIVFVIVGALTILAEIGVQTGPLIAGVGVIGVAVGFGAQTLIKDFITGIFLIVEDIVSVGDVVQIGDFGGLVEYMSLRTIRLRDFDGTLHVFPYGEAQVIHNSTKSFSYYVFDLTISYGSDIGRALDVMKITGDEVAALSQFAGKILAPIEIVGVDKLSDTGIVLKARIKTKPMEQWNVGREYNRRIKDAFDGAGIHLYHVQLKLVLPEASTGSR